MGAHRSLLTIFAFSLIWTLSIWTQSAFAEKLRHSRRQLRELFRIFYHSPFVRNNSVHCGKNVREFVRRIHHAKIYYEKAYIVQISGLDRLNVFNSRWYDSIRKYHTQWFHHVFLVVDGHVYDPAQAFKGDPQPHKPGPKSKAPRIQTLSRYLETMFLPKSPTRTGITRQTQLESLSMGNLTISTLTPEQDEALRRRTRLQGRGSNGALFNYRQGATAIDLFRYAGIVPGETRLTKILGKLPFTCPEYLIELGIEPLVKFDFAAHRENQ